MGETKPKVIIIGGGISGIALGDHLSRNGFTDVSNEVGYSTHISVTSLIFTFYRGHSSKLTSMEGRRWRIYLDIFPA
jgi:glycine/D-amino acid oxidase-like deaminating enzyme